MNAQLVFRDVYGNPLPTPSWPPPDSIYDHTHITAWFNRSIINKVFLCDYWEYYYNPNIIREKDNKYERLLEENGVGRFALTRDLILDSALYGTLEALGVTHLTQYSLFHPCRDSLSITRYGDTIPTPEFWNSFYIELEDSNAVEAVATLVILYGGSKLDFAELIGKIEKDATPNDNRFLNWQTNLQNSLYGENVVGAWDIQRGKRNIKVAVIDDGIFYTHPDFGEGIGPEYRVVDGREFIFPNVINPPSDYGSHGTAVAGMIGAKTNNELYVSSIAGGWYYNQGVSLYDMKIPNLDFYTVSWDFINAITFAVKNTSQNGFGVHIINNSNSGFLYMAEIRRAVDYAYRMGVAFFNSKGNEDQDLWCMPVDFDYNQVVAVGSYGIVREGDDFDPNTRWVPTRARGQREGGLSNYGYGLDIMAHGDNSNFPPLMNQTLACFDNDKMYIRYFSYTSAATPQVAAVGALILSQFTSQPSAQFWDYEDGGGRAISWLAPEDVEGLLSINAMDLNFQYNETEWDTTGYDSQTGYGMLKAGETLESMLEPYWLCHYSVEGGPDVGISEGVQIDDFIVTAPTDGNALLEPSQRYVREYKATRYSITRTVNLTDLGWQFARSWGRGGNGTIGWNGALPVNNNQNRDDTFQTGWCRVIGDAPEGFPFNRNNIRDISYRSDEITLETYCYQVTNKIGDVYLGWYPCEPIDVNYRFTVWGLKTPNDVEDFTFNVNIKFDIKCEVMTMLGEKRVLINYEMSKPGPVKIKIYDYLGNEVYTKNREVWQPDGKNTVSVGLENFSDGVYLVLIESGSSIGTGKFVFVD